MAQVPQCCSWSANRTSAGLLVIDIDDGNGKNGEAVWAALKLGTPPTVQTRTLSGGRHLIFKVPLDFPIK